MTRTSKQAAQGLKAEALRIWEGDALSRLRAVLELNAVSTCSCSVVSIDLVYWRTRRE